jgi:hypothetical protein
MLRIKRCVPVVIVAGALGVSAPAALGAANPNSNGCNGNIVATFNHNSGSAGASGNPNSSAGPGFFFGGDSPGSVPAAINGIARAQC